MVYFFGRQGRTLLSKKNSGSNGGATRGIVKQTARPKKEQQETIESTKMTMTTTTTRISRTRKRIVLVHVDAALSLATAQRLKSSSRPNGGGSKNSDGDSDSDSDTPMEPTIRRVRRNSITSVESCMSTSSSSDGGSTPPRVLLGAVELALSPASNETSGNAPDAADEDEDVTHRSIDGGDDAVSHGVHEDEEDYTEERFEEYLMSLDSRGWLTLQSEAVYGRDDTEQSRRVGNELLGGMNRQSVAQNDGSPSVNRTPLTPLQSPPPPRRLQSSDWFLEGELEGNSDRFDDFSTPAASVSPFRHAATNIHYEEEKHRQQRHRIRLEVLETAAEAYQKAKLDVPDVILAQINDEKGLSQPSSPLGPASMAMPLSRSLRENRQSLVRFDLESLATRKPTREQADGVAVVVAPTPPRSSQPQTVAKRFKLCPEDEVHVVPCQCALSLVGMTPFDILSPIAGSTDRLCASTSGGDASSTLSYLYSFFASSATSQETNLLEDDEQSQHPKLATLPEKPTGANMMRTASAKAEEDGSGYYGMTEEIRQSPTRKSSEDKPPATSQNACCSRSCGKKNPQPALFPTMPTTPSSISLAGGTFPSTGYHEITILRAGTPGTRSRRGAEKEEENEEGRCWDAISIRCCDHDEMDSVVNALRALQVVPFSHNPRSKLLAQISKKRQRKSPAPSRDSTRTAVDATTTTSTEVPGLERADTPAMTNAIPALADEEDVARGPKTWNHNVYCELCGFHFTLLTRRHHCRRCDRSCCGNCSSVMLVRGGGETRYCNRCSAEALEEQAAELRARFQKRSTAPIEIPGKVHQRCRQLGVGVGGKLPHWRNYLALEPSSRPAVGRLTVEVLEAMALPAMGMNGKADPYVRATLTGYERDMKWTLREWLPSNRYSLCSGYSSDTLSPVWRGSGRKGGELLTLPVITTAGAVLRLEILHYDVLTNSKGKDRVLGIVEIPLSDLPNANLRRPSPGRKRRRLSYDGFCDRWYRLQCPSSSSSSPSEDDRPKVLLSQPIPSPHAEEISREDCRRPLHEVLKRLRISKDSMEEIGNRLQIYCRAPLDWLGAALDIDIPRRQPESICKQHRSRSAVHVRIKLNASEVGDLLCHAWFPPVRPLPPMPPYDPQVLLKNVLRIGKQIQPIHRVIKFIEDAIKWQHEPRVCVLFFLVLAAHLVVFRQLLLLLHVYIFVFLLYRLHLINKRRELKKVTSNPEGGDGDVTEDASMRSSTHGDDLSILSSAGTQPQQTLVTETSKSQVTASPSLVDLAARSREGSREETLSAIPETGGVNDEEEEEEEEEGAKLNAAVSWIAKLIGDGKGLEDLQFKLGCVGKDLSNLNAIWNGTCRPKTEAALMAVAVSFAVHLRFHARWIWLLGMTVSYFGVSPMAHLAARTVAGFFRGVAKIIRRRHLHEMEMLAVKGSSRGR